MKKVIVIGSPGAGKSCFSRELSSIANLPLFHMDNIYWHADRTHISHDELVQELNKIMANDLWIIDGNYISTMELRIKEADTIFYLDFPAEICISGIKSRVGEKRDDIPWVEEELDDKFLNFVEKFGEETKPQIEKLLGIYTEKKLYRFTSREDIREFFKVLRKI
ncbi:MAG: adenylate kinase [Lachnospiraceae bacterium]|nr:adenylate kinase [Lachnospiraceae bacterium]